MGEPILSPQSQILGALACQRDSYLRTLESEVVSCVKFSPPENKQQNGPKKKKNATEVVPASDVWLIEFSDSVLFPEGGGQPCDYGSLVLLEDPLSEPIPVRCVERQGLRSVCHVRQPLEPGTKVRQEIDFLRRWDHMQQHTGQHLLSAVMDTYQNLDTLGWGMGTDGGMNYIDLPRKPSSAEIQAIQNRCNQLIRDNVSISVHAPNSTDTDGQVDQEKGLVRVISIGDLDHNACCGTHLSQTSHISLILLHHTQPIHSTNCRLFFSVGDRAIKISAESINALRLVAKTLSSPNDPDEIVAGVKRVADTAAEMKRQERKLLSEIAMYEGHRIKEQLKSGENAWVYRASGNLEFLNMIVSEVKDEAKDHGVVILAAGEGQSGGPLVVVGEKDLVSAIVKKVQDIIPSVKGGGKGEKWQGKVVEWQKGNVDSLRALIE
ncbi:Threonyl/alanyl tRNA synthetase [Mariannaea sp. PMI_226]|nr:Threonyl/alanyl tRNA synthetase [Mariannaea sp. PMI_226]